MPDKNGARFDFYRFHMSQVNNLVESAKWQADKASEDKAEGNTRSADKRLGRAHKDLDQASRELDQLRQQTENQINSKTEKLNP